MAKIQRKRALPSIGRRGKVAAVMHAARLFLLSCCAGLALPAVALAEPAGYDPLVMKEIDGSKQPAGEQFPASDVVSLWGPTTLADHKSTIRVENLRIHGVTNQHALEVRLCAPDKKTPNGEMLSVAGIEIENCDLSDVKVDARGKEGKAKGGFLWISGDPRQPFPADVLIQDVYVREGQAPAFVISDGQYGTITIRRLKCENTGKEPARVVMLNGGHVKRLVIDDCPDLKVSLIGTKGSIEACSVTASPGAAVSDVPNEKQEKSGAKITGIEPAHVAESTTSTTATQPIKAVTAKPRLTVQKRTDGVHIELTNPGDEVANIAFEVFDSFDYRLGGAVLTEGPWTTNIKVSRRGRIQVKATITRLGGDPDKPLLAEVELPKED